MRLVQTGISAALTGTPNQSSCALLASMPFMDATCSVSLQACMKPRHSARLQETSAFSRLQHMLPHRRDLSADHAVVESVSSCFPADWKHRVVRDCSRGVPLAAEGPSWQDAQSEPGCSNSCRQGMHLAQSTMTWMCGHEKLLLALLQSVTIFPAQHVTDTQRNAMRKKRPLPGLLRGLLHDWPNLSGNLGQPDLQAVALDRPDEGCGVLAVQ